MTRTQKKLVDRNVVNPNIDTKWFHDTLRDLGMSLREYERHPEIKAPSGQISRMFRGMRHFGPDDAKKFSRVTGADFTEVVRRAGGLETEDVVGQHVIPVEGWVDNARRVHFKGVKGPRKVLRPPDMAKGAIALRYQTERTDLDAYDGAIIYCRPLGSMDVGMINRWCYVRLKDGGYVIRILKRGSSSRVFTLHNDNDRDVMADVEIAAAAAIDWIKM